MALKRRAQGHGASGFRARLVSVLRLSPHSLMTPSQRGVSRNTDRNVPRQSPQSPLLLKAVLWGAHSGGQLGFNTRPYQERPSSQPQFNLLVRVTELNGEKARSGQSRPPTSLFRRHNWFLIAGPYIQIKDSLTNWFFILHTIIKTFIFGVLAWVRVMETET